MLNISIISPISILEWVKKFAIFAYMLVFGINFSNLRQSPNLASLNYYLLHLWCFNNQEEMEALVKDSFTLKNKNSHKSGIKELAERWL